MAYSIRNNNVAISNKLCTWLIVLAPLFDAYSILGSTLLSTVLVALVSTYIYIISKVKHFELPKGYIYFLLYGLSVPVLNSMFSFIDVNIKSSFISILYYSLCFGILMPFVKLDYFLKCYKIVVYIAFATFILQELCFFMTGYRFSALIPYLTIRYASTDMESFIEGQRLLGRSSSLFLEPAHFVQYTIPFLILQLGEAYRRRKLVYMPAIIATFIIFLSKSGNAILLLALVWIFFFVKYKMHILLKVSLLIPLVSICALFMFDVVAKTDFGKDLLERQQELEVGKTKWVSSGNIRISRGFLVFSEESAKDKLIGVGTGGTENIVEQSSYYWMFRNETYMNLAQSLLIGYGIIGTILFLIHILLLLRINTFEGRGVIVVFIGLAFIEAFLFSSKMLLYTAFAYQFQKSLSNTDSNPIHSKNDYTYLQ